MLYYLVLGHVVMHMPIATDVAGLYLVTCTTSAEPQVSHFRGQTCVGPRNHV